MWGLCMHDCREGSWKIDAMGWIRPEGASAVAIPPARKAGPLRGPGAAPRYRQAITYLIAASSISKLVYVLGCTCS
jgi:hypothetical protein